MQDEGEPVTFLVLKVADGKRDMEESVTRTAWGTVPGLREPTGARRHPNLGWCRGLTERAEEAARLQSL